MRPFFLSALVSLTLATQGFAAPVTVRSGEHGTFTRLVFSLPKDRAGWELGKSQAGYVLALEDLKADFKTKEVFDRIDRGRLIDLRPSNAGGQINLVLGCDCRAEAFVVDGGLLVVDIHDPSEPDSPPPDDGVEKDRVNSASDLSKLEKTPGLIPNPTALETRQISLPLNPGMAGQVSVGLALVPDITHTDPDELLDRQSRTLVAQKRLLEQLGRAATQGLLQPVEPIEFDTPRPRSFVAQEDHANAEAEPTAPNLSQGGSEISNVNFSAATSIDKDMLKSVGGLMLAGHSNTCLENSFFELGTWAKETPLPEQVGYWRGKLFSETDQIDPEAMTSLARLYLHFGFGAEAREVLRLAKKEDERTLVNSALARLVDGVDPPENPSLSNQMHCGTKVALWSMLAASQVLPSDEINVSSVLFTFSALPAHLRLHLGPELSHRLLSSGNAEAAQTVLSFARRGLQENEPHLTLADAQIDLSKGRYKEAIKGLETVVEANRDISPSALVALVQTYASENIALPEDTAALVAAFALEHRNGPMGPSLRRSLVTARALAGQFKAGDAELTEIEKRDGSVEAFGIRSDLYVRLSEKAGDIAFLTLVMDRKDDLASGLSDKSANMVAERLLSLGFPRQAGALLRGSASGKEGRGRRVLRSRVALAEFKPHNAEAELLGLSGEDIDMLRAQARALSGDHGVAHRLYDSLNEPEAAQRSAWLSSDWSTLSRSDDPAYAAIATLAAAPAASTETGSTQAPEETRILARNKALLQQSSASRSVLSDILAKNEVTVAPGN